MTIQQILSKALRELQNHKLPTPALDAEILLSFILKKDREYLFAHPKQRVSATQAQQYQSLIQRRAKFEPVAYLTGNKGFYGLNFYVNRNVLIPRPETELIIETIKKQIKREESVIMVDIGTGSGCLAIVLAKNFPQAQVFATDISKKALKVAHKNIQIHKVENQIRFYQGNLLKPLPRKVWLSKKRIIIAANLPYLNQQILSSNPAIQYEPRIALYGGKDGLKYYLEMMRLLRRFTAFAPRNDNILNCFLEINPDQKKAISKITKKHFPQAKIKIKKDLQGLNRIVIIAIQPYQKND